MWTVSREDIARNGTSRYRVMLYRINHHHTYLTIDIFSLPTYLFIYSPFIYLFVSKSLRYSRLFIDVNPSFTFTFSGFYLYHSFTNLLVLLSLGMSGVVFSPSVSFRTSCLILWSPGQFHGPLHRYLPHDL